MGRADGMTPHALYFCSRRNVVCRVVVARARRNSSLVTSHTKLIRVRKSEKKARVARKPYMLQYAHQDMCDCLCVRCQCRRAPARLLVTFDATRADRFRSRRSCLIVRSRRDGESARHAAILHRTLVLLPDRRSLYHNTMSEYIVIV